LTDKDTYQLSDLVEMHMCLLAKTQALTCSRGILGKSTIERASQQLNGVSPNGDLPAQKPTNYLRAFVAEYFDAGCGPRDHMLLEANELV